MRLLKTLHFKRALKTLALGSSLCIFASCSSNDKTQKEAQSFIDHYTLRYLKLYKRLTEAQWTANTRIVEGDSSNAIAVERAGQAFADFTGSKANIDSAQEFLGKKDKLKELQVKQLQKVMFIAANNPVTVSELVKKRIKAENEQMERLYGFEFKIDGKPASANEIDDALKNENNLQRRLKAWSASKEVGKNLKSGLTTLRDLRNQTVQALGFKSYFEYQVSEYGMSEKTMMLLIKKINTQLRPLYRELHTFARYELAKKYGTGHVPDFLPAHWLPNRWGQDWSSIVDVKGINTDSVLKTKPAEWIVRDAEGLYKSLGFPALPAVFWQRSSLYPLPPHSAYKKNNHASAWHMDLKNNVRSLMSIEPNAEWYETANHELGHIYYYLSYSNKNVPPLLREGANRAYHEAIGSLMGLAAQQKPFLENKGIIAKGTETDSIQSLLKEALNYVVFIPFAAGTMTEFEKELYSDKLPENQYNKTWWQLVKKYQGIISPSIRGEEYCDAATKTHINDDPAQYYDYALSYVILFQLHDHIAKKILHQDPHSTNYYGNKDVGKFLKEIMEPGSSKEWNTVLKERTGSGLSAQAMLDYFDPLMKWLKQQNRGRKYTLPEHI